MEGSQALSSMDTKSLEVLSTSHGRDTLLFIASRAKLAVIPSLCVFRVDRTHRSYRPDAGPQRPVNGCSPHVTSVQTQSLNLNGQLPHINSQVMTECSIVPRLNAPLPSPVIKTDASGRVEKTPYEGVTAILALRVINRCVVWPWAGT